MPSTEGEYLKQSLLLVSLLGLMLTGCKKEPYIVKSTLEVDQAFEVKHDNKKIVRLNPGSYPTDLNINTGRVKATLKTADKSSVVFRLLLPKSVKVPTNGSIELTSQQSGQPFHTTVNVKTEITNGELRRELENCSVNFQDYECYVTGNPPHSVCVPVTRTRWGRRTVEYYVRSYHRNIEALISPAKQEAALAKIEGSRVDAERIYTGEGMCY